MDYFAVIVPDSGPTPTVVTVRPQAVGGAPWRGVALRASTWSQPRRTAFSNDLTETRMVTVITAKVGTARGS